MKKLLFTLSLIFALSFTASAQERKADPKELAKKEASILNETVKLTDKQVTDLTRLFEMKYEMFQDNTLSAERISEFKKAVDLKIQATLTSEQLKTYLASQEKYNKLVQEATAQK